MVQFSSDLSYTYASFENTDKSNDERIVKAEARTKMKQGERTSGGSDNDEQQRIINYMRERKEINAARGIRENRKSIPA